MAARWSHPRAASLPKRSPRLHSAPENISLRLPSVAKFRSRHPKTCPKQACARITCGLPTIHKLSAQTSSQCLFLLKISGLSAIAVICLPEPCVAVRRRSLSRADLREDFIGAEFYGSGERHYLVPAGAFGFKSAVQFSTTLICPGDCSEALSIRKRWP